MKTKLFFLAFLTSLLSWGQATLPVSTDALSASSLPTGFTSIGLGANYTTPCSAALRLDGAGDSVRLFFSGTPGTLTYQLKANVGSGSWQGVFTIEESVDGVTWTTLRSITATGAISTAAGTTFTDSPLATTRYIRWTYTTKTNGNIGMCNVDLSAVTTSTPTLTVSATSVTAMDYVFGNGPSTPAKTFTVAGSNLAPLDAADRYVYIEPTGSDFEFSLDNSTFYTAGEIIPFPTGDGFSATTVYVRLKAGLPVGTYTDNTTITYYNAPTPDLVENISLSGEVTAVAATISTGTITGSPFCVTATTGTSVSVPFTSTGTFNAGNVYTAQLSNNAGSFASPVNIGTVTSVANSGTITATIPANTATGTGYRIHVVASNPTTTGANNGTNLIINLASNSIAPTATQTIPIGVNGNTLTVTETSTPISRVWKYGTAIGSYTTTTASTGLTYVPNFATANTYYVVCESTFACGTVTSNYVTINVNTPVITITGTPTLFTYAEGQGPSAYQTLNVSGTSLTDNITIAVPSANWELSTNTDFSAPSATITLNKNVTTHVVASTPVYVRLKAGLSQGQYEFPTDTDFVATSTNAITKTADLDGEVTAPVPFIDVKHVTATPQSIWGNGDATNTPSYLQNTLFGPITLDLTQTKQFYIENLGGAPLTINSIDILGLNPTDFFVSDFVLNSVSVSLPVVIPSNNSLYFSVTFDPTAIGDRNAIISINNNSNNIATYQFNVSGEGRNAEIGVTGNAVDIPNGNTAISATDNTFIGDANGNPANPSTVSQNFVISNSGNVALTISGITISGADASQFSVSPTTTSIAAGATGTITVTFAPTSIGVKNATINIANNDLTDGENPYTFAVQGNAVSYVTCAPDGEQTLIIQNFDNTAPIWNYTIGALSFYDFGGTSSDGFWGITTSGGGKSLANNINYSPITNNFLFLQDLQCENGDGCANTTGTGILTFDSVDISGRQNVKFSFDYDVYQFDTADDVFYELFYDGLSQGEVQFIDGLGDLTVEGTISINIPSTVNNFYFVLKIQQNGSDAAGFDNFKITYTQSSVKTWNGTAWSGDGLPPTASQKAIIDGTYNTTTNGDIDACSIVVNTGFTATITSGHYFNIQNDVTVNGTLNILNNGSLVQINDLGVNTGNILYQRTAMARNLDYVYWSSPVAAFNVNNLPNNYRYIWNTTIANTNGGQGNWVAASGNMIAGKGYIARASNGSATPIATTTSFVGVPNNGVVSMPILRGSYQDVDYAGTNNITITRFSDNWNLVGNPYPSAINVDEFLDLNTNIEGAVRIWTHGTLPSSSIDNPFYGSYQANYTPDDYITHNGVGTDSGPIGFNGFIAGGQGFMINMLDGAAGSDDLIFNNSLRSKTYNNSQFYRTSNEKNRIWLDLINNSNNTAKRTLIGYVGNATNDKDRLYDAFTSVGTTMHLYSIIANDKMTIQGRQLPFDANDKVNLGYFVPASGNYSIGIAALDGLFASGQNIYLEDKLLGVIHDLRSNPYSFSANAGEVNNRFVLRYTNETLGGDDFINNSDVLIFSSDVISVNAMSRTIQNVKIYNVLGQLLLDADAVNSNTFETSKLQKNNTTLLVQVTFENGIKVTKKIVF